MLHVEELVMNPCLFAAVGLLALLTGSAGAQSQSPYAGMQTRPIKALSEQQIADLKAARGMGLALAAELNGYPGPKHLLELADHLGLTDEQRAKIRQLFESMQSETIAIGEALIAEEAELDRRFANHSITEAVLKAEIDAIANIQGRLRHAHLKYHLATVELLTPAQMQLYAELRGYAGDPTQHHRPHHSD
jgi:Spy/CpxP family protein refolding chaperone